MAGNLKTATDGEGLCYDILSIAQQQILCETSLMKLVPDHIPTFGG